MLSMFKMYIIKKATLFLYDLYFVAVNNLVELFVQPFSEHMSL